MGSVFCMKSHSGALRAATTGWKSPWLGLLPSLGQQHIPERRIPPPRLAARGKGALGNPFCA